MPEDSNALKPPFNLSTVFGHTPRDTIDPTGQTEDPIAQRCREMAHQVQQETLKPVYNLMRPCRGEISIPPCTDVKLPDIRPRFYVFWGDSTCDCIESDDTEIMFLVVYNPYHNLTLCNVEVNSLRVVDMNGNAVPLLPDNTPSIQLVPRGKYCFGDIGPCGIGWRQFVLRLRGAPGGPYRILIEGICYGLCMHMMTEDCVTFNVCKD